MNARFFTVADSEIGLGHLYRCDALAQALREDEIDAELVVHSAAGHKWLDRLSLETSWRVTHWKDDATVVLNLAASCDTVIVDAYNLSPDVNKAFTVSARLLVYFDDYGDHVPDRGIVINGGPGSHLLSYPDRPGLVLLLGTDFQVLRRPFWTEPTRVVREKIATVGVMLGGTDQLGLIYTVTEAVKSAVPAETEVVPIGVDTSTPTVENVRPTGRLTAAEIKNLFDKFDFIVTAAGQTVAEAVSRLLPTILIETADNQRYNTAGWKSLEIAVLAGSATNVDLESGIIRCTRELLSYGSRQDIVRKARKLALWASPKRIARCLSFLQIKDHRGYVLTPFPLLSESSLREVLSWRNDDRVRHWMDRSEIIPWQDHIDFTASLSTDKSRLFYRVDRSGTGIGVINLTDIFGTSGELGLYRNPNLIEKGTGKLLMALIEDVATERGISNLRLKVLHDNKPAKKLYTNLKYVIYDKDERYEYRQKELRFVR
jgi:UDP-2,4-diacetamido-2,4,6-trideoxy-beta-L-altropyranose hydrolase